MDNFTCWIPYHRRICIIKNSERQSLSSWLKLFINDLFLLNSVRPSLLRCLQNLWIYLLFRTPNTLYKYKLKLLLRNLTWVDILNSSPFCYIIWSYFCHAPTQSRVSLLKYLKYLIGRNITPFLCIISSKNHPSYLQVFFHFKGGDRRWNSRLTC